MTSIVRVADRFVNVRGHFKVGNLVDISNHSSLVQRKNGNWLMLDSLKMDEPIKAQVDTLTDGGKKLDAILNLHPFHTLSCEWAHNAFPNAALYGSARHHAKLPNLPWNKGLLEDPLVRAQFKDDLDLRIPAGVDFISSNDSIHFSSIVAYHPDTKTIHVDDTFMFIPTPKIAEIFCFKEGTVQLHPTLAGALEGKAGASKDFREWMQAVIDDWDAENLCTAHLGDLLGTDNTGESIKARLEAALFVAEPVLVAHEIIHQ